MEEKLLKLYNNIKGEYSLPDYDTFKVDMADPIKSQKLHYTLTADNYDVPDYDTFTNDLGIQKKKPLLSNWLQRARQYYKNLVSHQTNP
jgi:hypothetical protein